VYVKVDTGTYEARLCSDGLTRAALSDPDFDAQFPAYLLRRFSSLGRDQSKLSCSQVGKGKRAGRIAAGLSVCFKTSGSTFAFAEHLKHNPSARCTAGPDESTEEAVGDWHYWVKQGYCL
jgi:hypothetical protein